MSKKIYLIDANSFIYRMFFALPEFSTATWKVVNATFGMAKFFVQQMVKEKPDYVLFIKDAKWDNFRHEIYSDYKATRERMPDNLRSQITDIEEMVKKMQIDMIEIPWYEADDVIGTLAKKLEKESNDEIYILSGDKDLYALVSEQVKIYDTQKKKISGPEETREKFGVDAPYVTDYLAICGDSSDNIPWVSGIGPKKVEILINEFGGVEEIYNVVDNVVAGKVSPSAFSPEAQKLFKGKTFEKILAGKEMAFLSKKLATLACDVELPWFEIDAYVFEPEKLINEEVSDLFQELEFHSLVPKNVVKTRWEDIGTSVQIIWDDEGLDELLEKITQQHEVVLDTETTNISAHLAQLVWVSVLLDEKNIYYINRLHNGARVSDEKLQQFIQSLFDQDIKIIWHNLKYDIEVLLSFLQGGSSDVHSSTSWQSALF